MQKSCIKYGAKKELNVQIFGHWFCYNISNKKKRRNINENYGLEIIKICQKD